MILMCAVGVVLCASAVCVTRFIWMCVMCVMCEMCVMWLCACVHVCCMCFLVFVQNHCW